MVNNNLIEGAEIIIAVQQNLGRFGKVTIIGESNGSSLCHISYLSHFLTLLALGYGTNNLNMYYSILFSPLLHSLNQSCCINNRIGIWHGSYSGVATSSCCLRAGSKILLGLLTWFSQMNMHVNQAWRNNFACSLHNLSTLNLKIFTYSSDFAILYQNICNLVYSIGWIYNPATFNQCFHTSLPPVSA